MLPLDLVIRVRWDGAADFDLKVKEPIGTVCSHRNRRTAAGGTLLNDDESAKLTQYVCAEAFNGEYTVTVERVWGRPVGAKVTLEVTRHQGTPRHRVEHHTIVVDKSNSVQLTADDGRRQALASVPHLTASLSDVAGVDRPKAVDSLWSDLRNSELANAYKAALTMVAIPDRTVLFLRDRMPPAPRAAERQIRRLIRDLGSDEFIVRQRATEELEQLDNLAKPELEECLKGRPSLEVRRRVESLFDQITHPRGDKLRVLRAVQVLEFIGTTEARQILETLAKGADGARLTREAQAALQRLMKSANKAKE